NGEGITVEFVAALPKNENGLSEVNGHFSHVSVNKDNEGAPQQTIAHEFGHLFGLLDVQNDKNLMNANFSLTGLTLFPNQQATVCGNLSKYGRTVTTHSPGQLTQQQFGAVGDDLGDIAAGVPSYLDLTAATLDSTADDGVIDVTLALAGSFPT